MASASWCVLLTLANFSAKKNTPAFNQDMDLHWLASGRSRSTVAEHSTHNPKNEGSNPNTDTVRETVVA